MFFIVTENIQIGLPLEHMEPYILMMAKYEYS